MAAFAVFNEEVMQACVDIDGVWELNTKHRGVSDDIGLLSRGFIVMRRGRFCGYSEYGVRWSGVMSWHSNRRFAHMYLDARDAPPNIGIPAGRGSISYDKREFELTVEVKIDDLGNEAIGTAAWHDGGITIEATLRRRLKFDGANI